MKTMLLILFSILPTATFAQDLKPRAVEPIRVSITTADGAPNIELASKLRSELQKSGFAAIVTRRGRLAVFLDVAPFGNATECEGYSVAAFIMDRRRKDSGTLRAYSAASLDALARYLAGELERENFNKERK
jgi:hypothetical protein